VPFEQSLPFGVNELDPQVVSHPDNRNLVRCYVRGCRHFVRRPTRQQRGEACPDHRIFCHYSRFGATYSYADVRRNIIASPNLFAKRIVGHPFKYESHRLGSENSEDALSWNVFRSLQEASCLARVARLLTGEEHAAEPDLYLWGIRVSDDSFAPWDLLIAARQRFERQLPVKRPLTEPDIALHLPGRYLILIEAKFTSLNPVYVRGPRQNQQSLTFDELLQIYWDPSLRILDRAAALTRHCIHYQLWRNMVFAEWMAKQESPTTKAYHVNLVRAGYEVSSSREFSELLVERFANRFCVSCWELILDDSLSTREILLNQYLHTKTAHLRKAFAAFHAAESTTAELSAGNVASHCDARKGLGSDGTF
jgi:hypothetical protein